MARRLVHQHSKRKHQRTSLITTERQLQDGITHLGLQAAIRGTGLKMLIGTTILGNEHYIASESLAECESSPRLQQQSVVEFTNV